MQVLRRNEGREGARGNGARPDRSEGLPVGLAPDLLGSKSRALASTTRPRTRPPQAPLRSALSRRLFRRPRPIGYSSRAACGGVFCVALRSAQGVQPPPPVGAGAGLCLTRGVGTTLLFPSGCAHRPSAGRSLFPLSEDTRPVLS